MHYPIPKHNGGRIISTIVRILRPWRGSINQLAIACSGGPDSMALAHAIIKYGRNVCPKEKLVLVHVNHNLRGRESDEDASFVQKYAESYGVSFDYYLWQSPVYGNLENEARKFRLGIYKKYPIVLTGHHRDDVIETVFWRFLRGELLNRSEVGVLPRYLNQIRPLLEIPKQTILDFLSEENQEFRMDSTNLDGSNTRSWLRTQIFPELRSKYPGFEESILKYTGKPDDYI